MCAKDFSFLIFVKPLMPSELLPSFVLTTHCSWWLPCHIEIVARSPLPSRLVLAHLLPVDGSLIIWMLWSMMPLTQEFERSYFYDYWSVQIFEISVLVLLLFQTTTGQFLVVCSFFTLLLTMDEKLRKRGCSFLTDLKGNVPLLSG